MNGHCPFAIIARPMHHHKICRASELNLPVWFTYFAKQLSKPKRDRWS